MTLGARCWAVLTCAMLALSGCISPRSYVDPSFPQATYDSVVRRREPLKLILDVTFQRSGTPFPRAQPTMEALVERTLRGSGVAIPTKDGRDGHMIVVINNFGDLGTAAAKGFGTGLTLGLVGSTITDFYEMSVELTVAGRTEKVAGVKGAIQSAIGNVRTPAGVELTTPDLAARWIVEAMLLSTLRDLQKSGSVFSQSIPLASSL